MSDEIQGAEGEVVESVAAPEPLSAEELSKRLQSAGRDLREQRAEIRSLREMIQMRPQIAAEIKADPAEPDMDVDPIGWMKYARDYMNMTKTERADQERQTKAQAEQQAGVAQIARRMDEYERDFRQDHPDYNEAAAHFRKARSEELSEEGASGAELTNALQQDLVNVVARAIRAGKDPAEVVYKLAKNRGFGVDTSTKKLQTIERAANAGKSLSQGGGRTGDGELTYEHVAGLTGKEFTEGVRKLKEQAKAAERRRA